MESILEKSLVESLIPQKTPFVMVDKLLFFGENTIIAGLTIPHNNIFVEEGRFVESGIVEHMAQSVALYTGYQFYLLNEPAPTGYIGSIKDVEVVELPLAGEELVTEVKVIQEFMGITLVDIVTKHNGVQIAAAQMKTVLAK
jgi:predicted hotdog family 3-hydroxylacyl-ACP dehydratase